MTGIRSLAGLALLATACSGNNGNSTGGGELDNGTFVYRCSGSADAACAFESPPSAFPAAIAVGGRFSMDYDPKDNDKPGTVRSAVESRVSRVEDDFTVEVAGFTAMLARNVDGDVLDLKHVRCRPVAEFRVRKIGGLFVDEQTLEAGDLLRLFAVPLDNSEGELAGSLDLLWETSDNTVVRLNSAAGDDEVEIQAVAPGEAMLTVTSGAITGAITITVTGVGSTTGTGTGTTGTTGTGSGTATGSTSGTTGTGTGSTGSGTGSTGGGT